LRVFVTVPDRAATVRERWQMGVRSLTVAAR
jgi:hypothetical protein